MQANAAGGNEWEIEIGKVIMLIKISDSMSDSEKQIKYESAR